MKTAIEPNKKIIEGFIINVENDLAQLRMLLDMPEIQWWRVKERLNTIHLDAREQRDYLYRCEGDR